MFFKSEDIKKEKDNKIGLIHNGICADIFKCAFTYTNFTLVPCPKEKDSFIEKYNSYKNSNGDIDGSVSELENSSAKISDYVLIHKDDYEKFLLFKRSKKIDSEKIELIKKEYSKLKSQRAVAKLFNISPATVNKIINGIY